MLAQATDRISLPIFSVAFRAFFLLGGVWSALALGIWIFAFVSGRSLSGSLSAVDWHIHEMLFGFVMAAIAGFILTAIANWTGRPPISGRTLAGLALLRVLGRGLNLPFQLAPIWLVAAVDFAFPLVLALLVAREIIVARTWHNLIMPVPIAVFGLADLLMYLDAAGHPVPAGVGWRLALAAVISLFSLIGARIIPTFTRNWLASRRETSLRPAHVGLDRLANAVLHVGLLGWVFLPGNRAFGLLLIVGTLLSLVRLASWQGWRTLREPLLAILHIGYLWIVIGAALLGAAAIMPAIAQTAAIHALTVGGVGTMVLAVMTRVCRGHTGRPLTADWLAILIYVLVSLAALTRVSAALLPGFLMRLLEVSAAFWIAAFLLFGAWAAPIVLRPRSDGSL